MTRYYSQADEDRILIERYLGDLDSSECFYIEAGAMDGVRYSNTKALEEALDWTGILIEPHPTNFAALQKNRPGNVLVRALISTSQKPLTYSYFDTPNLAAVSAVEETLSPGLRKRWYESQKDAWLVKAREEHLRTIQMQPKTLSQIVRDSGFFRFGLFSLDVEGHEYEVLKSYDWSAPIRYILVENNQDPRIAELLRDHDFTLCDTIAHNHLYVCDV